MKRPHLPGLLLALLLACTTLASPAAEGLWPLDQLPLDRLQKDIGFTPDAAFARRLQLGAARIDGGCSGAFVSRDGLVMTNHHCVADCVQEASPPGHALLTEGFLARRPEQELRCPDLGVSRLESIRDVTAEVRDATRGRQGEDFRQAFDAAKTRLSTDCLGGEDSLRTRCDVVKLYQGGRYALYRYRRFSDVRLVWAPERQVAFFGGDEHNFSFPRYNLDAAFLRVYDDGKPAALDDVLALDAQGPAEGEAVLAVGHPGVTLRGITRSQLLAYRDIILADDLRRNRGLHAALKRYAATGAAAAASAETLLFELENDAKAMRGESDALHDPALLRRRRADDRALQRFVASRPALRAEVGPAWRTIDAAQARFAAIAPDYYLLEKGYGFSSDLFRHARALVRVADEAALPAASRLPEYGDARLAELRRRLQADAPLDQGLETVRLGFALSHLRDRLGAAHPLVQRVLAGQSPEDRAAWMVAHTTLGDAARRSALLAGGSEALRQSDDPFIRLAREVDAPARQARQRYEQQVDGINTRYGELIASARFAKNGAADYPDGSYTLRLSYGRVQGVPRGAGRPVPVPAFTRVAGLFDSERAAEPFVLPASWKQARARLDPQRPFNFAATLDVSAGSSGSPVLNTRGRIAGMVFDINSDGLGCVFAYNGATGRAIGVDSGALATALREVYGAGELLTELGLPSP